MKIEGERSIRMYCGCPDPLEFPYDESTLESTIARECAKLEIGAEVMWIIDPPEGQDQEDAEVRCIRVGLNHEPIKVLAKSREHIDSPR